MHPAITPANAMSRSFIVKIDILDCIEYKGLGRLVFAKNVPIVDLLW